MRRSGKFACHVSRKLLCFERSHHGRCGVVMGYSSNLGIWPSGIGEWGGGGRGGRKKKGTGGRGEGKKTKIKQPHLARCEQKIRKPEMSFSRLIKIQPINNGHDRSPIEAVWQNWWRCVERGFRFAFPMSQQYLHFHRLEAMIVGWPVFKTTPCRET